MYLTPDIYKSEMKYRKLGTNYKREEIRRHEVRYGKYFYVFLYIHKHME